MTKRLITTQPKPPTTIPHQSPPSASPFPFPSLFLSLPPEIHTLIAQHLPYPDLLSLTLTHPLFTTHPTIHTTKTKRVDWLLSRATQSLPLPTQTRCRWSSDREFVSNPEVTSILRRRREHAECREVWVKGRSDGGCLVVVGRRCERIDEDGETWMEKRWIERASLRFGGMRGYVVEVRTGMVDGRWTVREVAGVVKSWQVAVVTGFVACILYLLV